MFEKIKKAWSAWQELGEKFYRAIMGDTITDMLYGKSSSVQKSLSDNKPDTRNDDDYTKVLPSNMLLEFNAKARSAAMDARDLTVERILISKALAAAKIHFFSPSNMNSIVSQLTAKTTDGHYEKNKIDLSVGIYGSWQREAKHERKYSGAGSYIRNGNTVFVDGTWDNVRVNDVIEKHIVHISRPDLISGDPAAQELVQLSNKFNLNVSFSVAQTSEISEGNQFITRNIAPSAQDDIKPSLLIITLKRNELEL